MNVRIEIKAEGAMVVARIQGAPPDTVPLCSVARIAADDDETIREDLQALAVKVLSSALGRLPAGYEVTSYHTDGGG